MTNIHLPSKLSVGRASPPAIEASEQGAVADGDARPTIKPDLIRRVSAVYRQSLVIARRSERLGSGEAGRMSASDTPIKLDPFTQLWMFDFDNTLVALEETVDWGASRQELEPMLRAAGCPAELFVEFPRGNLSLLQRDIASPYCLWQASLPTVPPRDLLQRAF